VYITYSYIISQED